MSGISVSPLRVKYTWPTYSDQESLTFWRDIERELTIATRDNTTWPRWQRKLAACRRLIAYYARKIS